MKLKYVGAMPLISDKGVGFDHTQPDKYTFLNAVAELLEGFDFGAREKIQHLHNTSGKEYAEGELTTVLKKYCSDIDEALTKRDEKFKVLKKDLIQRVHENLIISKEGKDAWLNNIELMNDYCHQFVTNDTAYQCALRALGEELYVAKIEEVTFPMFRNYGLVLHDLDNVLQHRKPPIDTTLTVETGINGFVGKLTIVHR